jgi:hypothetical protein
MSDSELKQLSVATVAMDVADRKRPARASALSGRERRVREAELSAT